MRMAYRPCPLACSLRCGVCIAALILLTDQLRLCVAGNEPQTWSECGKSSVEEELEEEWEMIEAAPALTNTRQQEALTFRGGDRHVGAPT